MIYFIRAEDLPSISPLPELMFKDRTTQFVKRRGWKLNVNARGEERDQYDFLNPIYIIIQSDDGRHEASMRLLPTTGQTMVNDHFLDMLNGEPVQSRFIWECTRFCLGEAATRRTTAKLMAAGGKVLRARHLQHFVGVFDEGMKHIYRRIGSEPQILGEGTSPEGTIGVGLWAFDDDTYDKLLRKAAITSEQMDAHYAQSLELTGDRKSA